MDVAKLNALLRDRGWTMKFDEILYSHSKDEGTAHLCVQKTSITSQVTEIQPMSPLWIEGDRSIDPYVKSNEVVHVISIPDNLMNDQSPFFSLFKIEVNKPGNFFLWSRHSGIPTLFNLTDLAHEGGLIDTFSKNCRHNYGIDIFEDKIELLTWIPLREIGFKEPYILTKDLDIGDELIITFFDYRVVYTIDDFGVYPRVS